MEDRRKMGREESRIEQAVFFLCDRYRESGHNAKPVVPHSLRVAFEVFRVGASADAVIAAILHDMIEDSAVTFADISENFGEKIARTVSSLTENENIAGYGDRYKENFTRIMAEGGDAILVRLADMYDNSFYISKGSEEIQKLVLDKIAYFLDLTTDTEHKEMYGALKRRYEEEFKEFGK